MKRLVCSLIIFLFTVILSVFSAFNVNKSAKKISDEADYCISAENSQEEAEKVIELWNKNKILFYLFSEKSNLDEIQRNITRLEKENICETSEVNSILKKIKESVGKISENEKISFYRIF